MCGRIGQTATPKEIQESYAASYAGVSLAGFDPYEVFPDLDEEIKEAEKELDEAEGEEDNAEAKKRLFETKGRHNVGAGNPAILVHNAQLGQGRQVVDAMFGFTPSWSPKLTYQINARAEGAMNPENSANYSGPWGIFDKPYFKEAIRSRRCVLPVSYFVEGPQKERLSKPFVIVKDDASLFSLGGIWNLWTDRATGEQIMTFAIVTTAANAITSAIGHHRAPLLIKDDDLDAWLDPATPIERVEAMFQPFLEDRFIAYPIDKKIKRPNRAGNTNSESELVRPTGSPISPTGYAGVRLHENPEFSWMFNADGTLKEEFLPPKPTDNNPEQEQGKDGQISLF